MINANNGADLVVEFINKCTVTVNLNRYCLQHNLMSCDMITDE